jgi:hypothetical protein
MRLPLTALTIALASALALGGVAASAGNSRPTVKQIDTQTRSAVRASRATVVGLQVMGPNLRYALRIAVSDPAAYLKYRFARVVATVNRLTNRERRFQSRTLTVVGRSGIVAFSVSVTQSSTKVTTRWYVRTDFQDCARHISGFDVEIDPDHTAPPCPVARR